MEGESLHGVPLYVEAVTPPLKALHHLLDELARVVDIHQRFDIGFSAIYGYFPGPAGEVWIDFADGSAIARCPREGTAMFFQAKRRWFGQRYAELQQHALANGRYFPPPKILRARTGATGPIRVEMGFAHGFLPGDRLFVLAFLPQDGRSETYLLTEDEPIPDRPGMRGLLETCAKRWQQPGETLWWVGHLWLSVDEGLPREICEGDELFVRRDSQSPFDCGFYWQGRYLGLDLHNQYELRQQINRRQPFCIRIVRLDYIANDFRGRIAYAVYGLPRLV